jgi:hypothetical protein
MQATVLDFPPTSRAPRTTLADLAHTFAERESRENPDIDVPLSSLTATAEGTIDVPGHGEFGLNDWSRAQLSHSLGFTWDRFFAGAGSADRSEDLNRRLRRAGGVVRLRTTSEKPDDGAGDGTIRAVVTRGFTPVKDTLVTSLLADALRVSDPYARIVRSSVTDLSTSFVVKLGEAFKPGGPGRVGEVWGGLLVRNSGVGYSRLVVDLHLVRLACLNGMVCPVQMPAIVRARHAWLDEAQIREAIHRGLDGVGEKLRRGTRVLEESAHHGVDDVEAEVRRVLQNARLGVRLARPVLEAYSREPHPSRFGVSQALTLAAQSATPEVRLQLEEAAGRYLASSA